MQIVHKQARSESINQTEVLFDKHPETCILEWIVTPRSKHHSH